MKRLTTAIVLLASLTAADLPKKGEPPLTKLTMISGGVRPAEQLALSFDAADLAFDILPDTEQLKGVATLSFTAKARLTTLLIDLDRNLPVSAIQIDGVALRPGDWSNPEGRLAITLPRAAAAGQKIVARLTYGGTPHVAIRAPWDDGVVWSKTPAGATWFATTAEGYGCDLFWPCLDFPNGEPGQVTLHITVPKGLKAPSNGVLLGVDALPDGRTTWNWRIKHPNTYGVALNVGPYEEISGSYKSRYGNTIPMFYWYLPGEKAQADKLFAEFAPTLDFFETLIGPYPFGDEKLGVVETPHKGMEHQTINAYGNEYAKAPEGFDWLFQHEFSHEWFGNQVTAANWDDYWIHEGYGSYMQPLYGRWREGDARYAAMLATQRATIRNKVAMVRDKVFSGDDVYEDERGGPGGDIYVKGSWVLHTLRGLIGDKAFFDATRLLVYGRTDPRPGNFTPRYGSTVEYQRFVRQVTGKDYDWFFNVYFRAAALPDLIQKRAGDRLTLTWKTPGDLSFPMPVEVQVGERIERLTMAGGTGSLTVPAGAHVVIDPWAKILKRSVAIEDAQAWRAAQAKRPN